MIQSAFLINSTDYPHAERLKSISKILEGHLTINNIILDDLTGNRVKRDTGAQGMSVEQVLRADFNIGTKIAFQTSHNEHIITIIHVKNIKDELSR